MSDPSNNGRDEQGTEQQFSQERYSQRRRWPHLWPRRQQVSEPETLLSVSNNPQHTPLSGVVPPVTSPSLRNATALPLERQHERYTGSAVVPPDADEDSTPTLDRRLGMVLQRFSGTGVAPLTAIRRQEGRARAITLALVTAAMVVVLVSAVVLFDPFVRHPGIGMQAGQQVRATSTASAIVSQQVTPTGGIAHPTPILQGQPTNATQAHSTTTPSPHQTATPVDPHAPRVHETADFSYDAIAADGGGNLYPAIEGNDGNYWIGENDQIERVTTSGQTNIFAIPTAGVFIPSMAIGRDGNLWFTEREIASTGIKGKIGEISQSGAIIEYVPSSGVGRAPDGSNTLDTIANGPDGNLWYSDNDGLFRMTTSGVNLDQGPLTFGSVFCCTNLTTGPDNNLWGTATTAAGSFVLLTISSTGQELARYANSPFGNSTSLSRLVVSNNALWILDRNKSKIDRILPSGTINAMNLPSTCQQWDGLSSDTSGRLWLTCKDTIPGATRPPYIDYSVLDPTTGQFQFMYTDVSNSIAPGEGLTFGSDGCLYSEVLEYKNNTPNGLILKYCTHP